MSKEAVAKELAKRVKDGDVIGLGSGSTVELALKHIGIRVAEEKLNIVGVPTSIRTARQATDAGVRVISNFSDLEISWAFDGADEVDPNLNLIKGRGAAMLPEKIVAKRAKHFVVEIIPEALSLVKSELKNFNPEKITLRTSDAKYGPTITENGNLILDVNFSSIPGKGWGDRNTRAVV